MDETVQQFGGYAFPVRRPQERRGSRRAAPASARNVPLYDSTPHVLQVAADEKGPLACSDSVGGVSILDGQASLSRDSDGMPGASNEKQAGSRESDSSVVEEDSRVDTEADGDDDVNVDDGDVLVSKKRNLSTARSAATNRAKKRLTQEQRELAQALLEDAEAERWAREDAEELAQEEHDWRDVFVETHRDAIDKLVVLLVDTSDYPFSESTFACRSDVIDWILAMHERLQADDVATDISSASDVPIGDDAVSSVGTPCQRVSQVEQAAAPVECHRRQCAVKPPGFYRAVETKYDGAFELSPAPSADGECAVVTPTAPPEDIDGTDRVYTHAEEVDVRATDSPDSDEDYAEHTASSSDGGSIDDDDESSSDAYTGELDPDDLEVIGRRPNICGGVLFYEFHRESVDAMWSVLEKFAGTFEPASTCLAGVSKADFCQALYDAEMS